MKNKQIEKKLEGFARYIYNLSPHNFYDRNHKGIVDENAPLDKYKVLNIIQMLAKGIYDKQPNRKKNN